jgi:hypothetical protein
LYVGPRKWRPIPVVFQHLAIERLGFGLGAELTKEHASEETWVALRSLTTTLCSESHDVAGIREQTPGNRHFCDVEVSIGQWDKDLCDVEC